MPLTRLDVLERWQVEALGDRIMCVNGSAVSVA